MGHDSFALPVAAAWTVEAHTTLLCCCEYRSNLGTCTIMEHQPIPVRYRTSCIHPHPSPSDMVSVPTRPRSIRLSSSSITATLSFHTHPSVARERFFHWVGRLDHYTFSDELLPGTFQITDTISRVGYVQTDNDDILDRCNNLDNAAVRWSLAG